MVVICLSVCDYVFVCVCVRVVLGFVAMCVVFIMRHVCLCFTLFVFSRSLACIIPFTICCVAVVFFAVASTFVFICLCVEFAMLL